MLTVYLNTATALRVQAYDGNGADFPQFLIYDGTGTVVATLNATHIAGGLYTASWTPATEGLYTLVGTFYTDSGHTSPDTRYSKVTEDLDVSSLKASVARLLGLVQENTVIDSQVYDGLGNLTSSRIRSYDSKAHAQAAGSTGLLASYTMTATYSALLLTHYSVVRDS